jgi:hypothetical protein
MERLAEGRIWNLPPLRLYVDDVEEIMSILKEQCANVAAELDEYRIKDRAEIEEMAKIREEVVRFKVEGWSRHGEGEDRYVYFEGRSHGAQMYVNNCHDAVCLGLAEKVMVVLAKRRRWGLWLLATHLLGPLMVLSMTGLGVGCFLLFIGKWGLGAMSAAVGLVSAWGARGSYLVACRRHSVLRLRRAREATGFLRRNRDELIRTGVAAVLAAVLGVLGTLAVGAIQCERHDKYKTAIDEQGKVAPSDAGK